MVELSGYAGLFLVSLLAATIIPAQSESVLVALLLLGKHSPWLLVTVASVGNVLGAVISWLLGRYLETWRNSAWFPVSDDSLDRAQSWYHRLGRWSLLLSWLPIIGDPLTGGGDYEGAVLELSCVGRNRQGGSICGAGRVHARLAGLADPRLEEDACYSLCFESHFWNSAISFS